MRLIWPAIYPILVFAGGYDEHGYPADAPEMYYTKLWSASAVMD